MKTENLHGYIECRVTRNALGVIEQTSFKLIGGPFISVDDDRFSRDEIKEIEQSGIINIGPYKLKVISYDVPWGLYRCVRMDYRLFRMYVFAHIFSDKLRIIKARIIITLAVWGLADYDASKIPSVRDIHLVKRFMK